MLLKIDLQDGFIEDLVIIKVNGREAFHKDGVKTRLMLSYADSVEADVPEDELNIEITLPKRNISKNISLKASDPIYLGLSVQDNKISCRLSKTMFYYL